MRKKTPKSRSNGVENIKLMIVAISLTATLLFWSVFSAYDSRELVGETQNSNSALVINLPPVPTVVPINNNEEEEDSIAGPQPIPTLRSVTEPEKKVVVPQSGPVIVGGGGGGRGGGGSTSTKAS